MKKETKRLIYWGAGVVGGLWFLRQWTLATIRLGYAQCQLDRGENPQTNSPLGGS